MRAAPILIALTFPSALAAQSAPPLTDLRIDQVNSATQAERIAPGATETARRHGGPVTLIVRERGVGRARLLRIDGAVATRDASTRPLCGAAVTAGACRPGEPMTGLEVTYHLGALPPGTMVSVQDISANLPIQTLTADITIR